MTTDTREIVTEQVASIPWDPDPDLPITRESTAWLIYLALRKEYWELKLKFQEN